MTSRYEPDNSRRVIRTEQPQLTTKQGLRHKALRSYVETGRMVCPFCERRFSKRQKDFLRHLLRCEERKQRLLRREG